MRIVRFGWLPMFKILFICNVTEIDAGEAKALCSFFPFLPIHIMIRLPGMFFIPLVNSSTFLKIRLNCKTFDKTFHMHLYHCHLFTPFFVSSKCFIYLPIWGLLIVNFIVVIFLHSHFHYLAIECLKVQRPYFMHF